MPYMCTAYGRLYRSHYRTVGVVWVCPNFVAVLTIAISVAVSVSTF